MRFRWIYLILTALIAVCLYPVYLIIWSSGFAEKHGCTLHEGFQNPCIVDGVDYGERLYTAFVSGWFLLVTGPIAVLCAGAMIVIAIRDIIKAAKARK